MKSQATVVMRRRLRFHRWVSLVLTLLGLTWGFLAGASFAREGFVIEPTTALMGMGAVMVLAVTAFRLGVDAAGGLEAGEVPAADGGSGVADRRLPTGERP